MCLKRDTEYYSSTESINEHDDLNLEWPLGNESTSRLIVACNICSYPITYEEHIVDEIRNENNISFGIVIPKGKLFRKVGIFCDNSLEQWRTEVYCPNCGIILSFLSPHRNCSTVANFTKIIRYSNLSEQIVILWTYPLFRGSYMEAKSRFTQLNEF